MYNAGMVYFALTCIVLLAAVLTNSFSAWLQRRHKFYDHLGPTAWNTHQFVIAPAWLVFFVMSTQIGVFIDWPLPFSAPELGWILLVFAILLFISAVQVLGLQSLTNGDLFDDEPKTRVRHGVYKYLNHPIYDSLSLAYGAVALITNNAAYILLGAILHLLLNHVQARLETID